MNHITADLFLRYVSDQASEIEQLQADTHLATCSDCRERLGVFIYLGEHVETILNSWTATEHGRLYRQWQLLNAIQKVTEQTPHLAGRLWRYIEQGKAGLEMTLRLLLDRTEKLATAAAGSLPPNYVFNLRPAIAGVGSPAELAKLQRQLRKGSEHLSKGDQQSAFFALQEAARIDARSPQVAVMEINREEHLLMQVTVDGQRGRVWVRFFATAGEPLPELALLLPASPEAVPYIAEFKPVNEEEILLAEFALVEENLQTLLILFAQ